MKLSIEELKDLYHLFLKGYVKKEEVVEPRGITIRVRTKKDSEILTKPLDIGVDGQELIISEVGGYEVNNLRIWIVKE